MNPSSLEQQRCSQKIAQESLSKDTIDMKMHDQATKEKKQCHKTTLRWNNREQDSDKPDNEASP